MLTDEQKLNNMIDANIAHILAMSDEEIIAEAMEEPCRCQECGWEGFTVELADEGSCPSCGTICSAIVTG